MRYGTLSIKSLGNSCVFKSFAYSKVNIDIKLNDATFRAAESSFVQMKGLYGKNHNSGKTIKIEASYGSVSLFE